jgi:DNA-binding response OmpR family regulator
MRKRDDLAQVPVIVVTAKDLTAEDHKRLNGEVDNILQKGDDDREKLMDEVHQYVNRAHAACRSPGLLRRNTQSQQRWNARCIQGDAFLQERYSKSQNDLLFTLCSLIYVVLSNNMRNGHG